MGPSGKTQHAIRRSTRLPLEIPVSVTSLDDASPFSVQCNTTLVNAHGCGLVVARPFERGTPLRLEIISAKRDTTARVVAVVPLGGDPETWLVGLELDVPGNFWGIDYAPSDWKIEETIEEKIEEAPASADAPEAEPDQVRAPAPEPVASKPVPARRWRLTDISASACYLETAAPFPAGTPVVLSIRASNAECLLEGIVRASHPQTGMAIEFTGGQPRERQARVEELIERLTSNREVPKIFVGRKEGRQAVPSPEPAMPQDDESEDPLLELVRSGASLTAEQFLDDLRAQRLARQRDS